MADNRKYYYLKLKENYFDDDSIVLLESMQDGILYSYILLKLYLKSLKHGGRLQLDESIPYTPADDRHHHPPANRHRGKGNQDFLAVGAYGADAGRGFLHDQHRTADRPILHRGGAETAGAAGKSACAESWWTNVRPLSGHSSTRDRERVRERERES